MKVEVEVDVDVEVDVGGEMGFEFLLLQRNLHPLFLRIKYKKKS